MPGPNELQAVRFVEGVRHVEELEDFVERLAMERVEVGPRPLARAYPGHRRQVPLAPGIGERATVELDATGRRDIGNLPGDPGPPVNGSTEDVEGQDLHLIS